MNFVELLSQVRKEERQQRRTLIAEEFAAWDEFQHAPRVPLLMKNKNILRCSVSGAKDGSLLPHQQEGVSWLLEKHAKADGCILADEMGLGKTVQICRALGYLFQRGDIKHVLIVAPATLLEMWVTNVGTWSSLPHPAIVKVHEQKKKVREEIYKRFRGAYCTCVVTTYGIMEKDSSVLAKYHLDYICLDEAQCIRNSSSKVHRAACMLHSAHKIAITGTPIMNNFLDLWSLLCFADPKILGCSRERFKNEFQNVLSRANEKDARFAERKAAESKLCELKTRICPYLLRREKKEVAAISASKTDLVLWVKLTLEQEEQYKLFLESDEVKIALRRLDTANPLVLLTSLKKLCDHTWLNFTHSNFVKALMTPFSPPIDFPNFGALTCSSKVKVAVQLLTMHKRESRKTLVFSQSKRLLQLLSVALQVQEVSVSHLLLTGDVAVEQRGQLVEKFERDAQIDACLLTTHVGGVGLTFCSATRVIILDPSWNPAVDNQAIDRVYRIGQKHDVIVYRLISCGTVEEKVYRNQIFKLMAARQTTESTKQLPRYFTHYELRSMFEIGNLQASETAHQLNEIHGPPPMSIVADSVDSSDHGALFGEAGEAEEEYVPEERLLCRRRRRERGDKRILNLSQTSSIPSESPTPETWEEFFGVEIGEQFLDNVSPRVSVFGQAVQNSEEFLDCIEEDMREIEAAAVIFHGIKIPKLDLTKIHADHTLEEDEDEKDDMDSSGDVGNDAGEQLPDVLDGLQSTEPSPTRKALRLEEQYGTAKHT